MGKGLLLVLLTGLSWGGLGIVMSLRADRKESPLRFLFLSYILGALGTWLLVVDWRGLWRTPQPRLFAMSGWALAAGVLSALHVMSLQAAMRRGNHAVTWACAQSALALSFLASVVVWGEQVAMPAWVGLGLVIAALLLLGRPGRCDGVAKPGWRFWVAATWLLIGAQQTCASVVSHWEGWQDVGRMRPALAMTATLCVLAVKVLRQRECWGQPWPWRHSAMFAVCGASGFSLMYPALDLLSASGASAIVFPLAVGTSIMTVSLWRIRVRGERADAVTLRALAVLVVGLLMLAWRGA
jgi:drug/metabolite transporter (DMT)-like permease